MHNAASNYVFIIDFLMFYLQRIVLIMSSAVFKADVMY